MGTAKSTQREGFEEDTLPHLETLWRAAHWLTMRKSCAEDLVLRAMTRAYRTWHASTDTVSTKARLFRILCMEFDHADYPGYQPDRSLLENGKSAPDDGNGNGRHSFVSIKPEELPVLLLNSDVSVKGALAGLSVQSRFILILRMRERFSYEDISYITGLHRDSVKSILERFRRVIPRYLVLKGNGFMGTGNERTRLRVRMASSDDSQGRG